MQTPNIQPLENIKFKKSQFHDQSNEIDTIDYYQDSDVLYLHISPMALRCLLFSLLSLDSPREKLEACDSISAAMTTLQEQLNKLLLSTFQTKLGIDTEDIKIKLKGLALSTFQDESTDEYRKTVGLFIYLLKAMSYLAIEDNSKFKFRRRFSSIRKRFDKTIVVAKQTAFDIKLQKAGLK